MTGTIRNAALAAIGLSALIAASPASAADTALTLWNGVFVDTGTGTSTVDLGPDTLGGVSVTLSRAVRATDPNGLAEVNINIDNTSSVAQTFNLIAGANGFEPKGDEFKLTATIFSQAGSSTLTGDYFVDPLNTLNGQNTGPVVGTNIGSFDSGALTGTESFSFNGFGADLVTGPYGLAESLTLTLQPGAEVGVQGIGMVSVPEPKTWVLSLIGFGLLGLAGLKRSRSARFAV